MKRNYYHIVLLLAGLTLLGGCKKYLTVQPEASYTEDQVFTSETGITQALSGLYNDLAGNALYGANLTTTTVEILGQHYNTVYNGSANNYSTLQTYKYTDASVQSTFDQLWTTAYNTILAANKFISRIDGSASSGVLSAAKAQELKGEAIALRAFVHFDLLRLFGPIYATSPDAPAIPYYRNADGNAQSILSSRQVLDSVLADFTQAESLLGNDPVITDGIVSSQDYYSGLRNQRLNYFAVKGLMARAYLWGGNKSAAHDSAQAVLTQGEKWFPWTVRDNVVNGIAPNRIFSPEMIFGVYNINMYTDYTNYFSSSLLTGQLLTAQPGQLNGMFESNNNDYRYTNSTNSANTWTPITLGDGTSAYGFDKYRDVPSTTASWRFLQPLLRKSEMYYIVAETSTDPGASFNALDTVRLHRGLAALSPSAVITTEIKKEYQKEFWGEGQVFFYYKRTNTASVPDGTEPAYYYTVRPVYQVPLPLSETTPR